MKKNGLCVLIPLRGGSKSIPRKNIRPLKGKPLCFWTIEAALGLGIRVYISSEDREIKSLVMHSYPSVHIIDRPDNLACDETTTEAVIEHFFSCTKADHVVLVQATSPLTTTRHLQEAIEHYKAKQENPLITCVRKHQFIWTEDGLPVNYDPLKRPRRQDWKGCLVENGAFYIFSRISFFQGFSKCRCHPPVTIYEMPARHSIEVDEVLDWRIIESIIERYD